MLEQLDLHLPPCRARGPYLTEEDQLRLTGQRQIVFDCLSDGKYRSLQQISEATGEREASISARWRELRQMKRWYTHKYQVPGCRGLYMYRIDITKPHVEEE
jgi:hypothetical protein